MVQVYTNELTIEPGTRDLHSHTHKPQSILISNFCWLLNGIWKTLEGSYPILHCYLNSGK